MRSLISTFRSAISLRHRSPIGQSSKINTLYLFFAACLIIGLVLVTIGPYWLADQSTNSELTIQSVTPIRNVNDWSAATASSNCVHYVDCVWNPDVIIFGRTFSEFAIKYPRPYQYRTASVTLNDDFDDPLWKTLEKLWKDNQISSGGMKNLNGAGRVVWFKEGKVVDSAWDVELCNAPSLKARTDRAFK
jgi:hypothetical protein